MSSDPVGDPPSSPSPPPAPPVAPSPYESAPISAPAHGKAFYIATGVAIGTITVLAATVGVLLTIETPTTDSSGGDSSIVADRTPVETGEAESPAAAPDESAKQIEQEADPRSPSQIDRPAARDDDSTSANAVPGPQMPGTKIAARKGAISKAAIGVPSSGMPGQSATGAVGGESGGLQPNSQGYDEPAGDQLPGTPSGTAATQLRLLKLPPRAGRVSLSRRNRPVELTKIDVADPRDCQLTLDGGDVVLDQTEGFKLEEVAGSQQPRIWNVVKESSRSVGSRGTKIATFQLTNGSLAFQWESRTKPQDERLKYFLLRLNTGADEERFRLSEPDIVPAVKLGTDKAETEFEIPLRSTTLPNLENLRLDVTVYGLPLPGFSKFENPGSQGSYVSRATGARSEIVLRILDENAAAGNDEEAEDLDGLAAPARLNYFKLFASVKMADKGCRVKLRAVGRFRTTSSRGSRHYSESSLYRSIVQKVIARHNMLMESAKINLQKEAVRITQVTAGLAPAEREKQLKENRYARLVASCESDVASSKRMLDLLNKIDEQVRIGYQLYIEIEGQRVELLRAQPP